MKKDDAYWQKKLTPDQYQVCRMGTTETPFNGKYYKHKEKGTYNCVACGQELFSSDTKFDSGTGWPSFYAALNREHIELREDKGHGMSRVEVRCKACGSHLGHVFEDGPNPTGKRYCINSAALDFKSSP